MVANKAHPRGVLYGENRPSPPRLMRKPGSGRAGFLKGGAFYGSRLAEINQALRALRRRAMAAITPVAIAARA